jgi:hypothetical protein
VLPPLLPKPESRQCRDGLPGLGKPRRSKRPVKAHPPSRFPCRKPDCPPSFPQQLRDVARNGQKVGHVSYRGQTVRATCAGSAVDHFTPPTARIIATMPVLIASGSVRHGYTPSRGFAGPEFRCRKPDRCTLLITIRPFCDITAQRILLHFSGMVFTGVPVFRTQRGRSGNSAATAIQPVRGSLFRRRGRDGRMTAIEVGIGSLAPCGSPISPPLKRKNATRFRRGHTSHFP